ncbi:uncharacterized protein PV06_11358 [Exophiala oligosperma]|uniref:DRBM domain-containing protein n=1 Tax=Exophiala oligosperma TaxID=215243 RepID=A0A0D2A7Q3_9EURO|nr:uncharacterized protein PV06_11358 [Exophiala oligosperma]KIW36361.1 hypothetical protein PV06_11358 [Exophiala oligosperma]
MATSAPSTTADSRSSMTYDMGFGDSDDDDFSMNGDHADLNVDYWFGKKYFECRQWTTTLHSYPYRQVLQRLSGMNDDSHDFIGDSSAGHAFHALVTEVGRTVRIGPREGQARLLQRLRQPLPRPTRGTSAGYWHNLNDSDVLPGSDPGKFASALNEYGQQHGFVTSYEYETSPGNMQCIAVALCGEETFRASGRNKKVARHAAAYHACRHFGIRV